MDNEKETQSKPPRKRRRPPEKETTILFKEGETKLSKTTIQAMVIVALFFDLLTFLVNLIPIAGQILSIIIAVIAYGIFIIWFLFKRVKLVTSKRFAAMGSGLIVELIPIVNMLPGVTSSVVLTILSTKVKEVEKKTKSKKNVIKLARQSKEQNQNEKKQTA